MRNRAAVVVLCALAAAWAGCASSRPNFYTLSALAKPSGASTGSSVAVGPVTVPYIVDRPQIVVRTGPNQVDVDDFNLWGSPLGDDIARVVAANLAATLGTSQVSVSPAATSFGARYRVAIDVILFDSSLGDSATLDAVWVVRSPKDGQSRRGRTTLREAVQEKGYPALVAAHSRGVEKLSADIAAAVRALEGSGS
jgi:uncharacterized lipoprotein YmbA